MKIHENHDYSEQPKFIINEEKKNNRAAKLKKFDTK